MFTFIKRYCTHLLMIIGGLCAIVNYFSERENLRGFIWLVLVMIWGGDFYQQYQKDKVNKK